MFAVMGSTGTLGTALRDVVKNGKFHTRKTFDVRNLKDARRFLMDYLEGCSVVVNAVAYTNVSLAEKEREECHTINVKFPEILADVCNTLGITLIHISTDYVFDGKKGVYTEDDNPEPLSWYGKTKRISEDKVLEKCKSSYVVRTSWLFGKNGKNFFSVMPLKVLRNEEVLTHDKQLVCPTPAKFLAEQILKIPNLPGGIYHITGKTPLTPFEGTILVKDALNSSSPVRTFEPDLRIRPKVSILLDTKINYPKPPFVQSVLEYIKTSPSQ